MEVLEKEKRSRTKEVNRGIVPKTMNAITDNTIRGIVKAANEEGIKVEDIVSLLKENGQFVLVYFR